MGKESPANNRPSRRASRCWTGRRLLHRDMLTFSTPRRVQLGRFPVGSRVENLQLLVGKLCIMAAQAALCSLSCSAANARPIETPQPSAAPPLQHRRLRHDQLRSFCGLATSVSSGRRREPARTCTAALKPFQEDSRKTRDRRFKDNTPDLPLVKPRLILQSPLTHTPGLSSTAVPVHGADTSVQFPCSPGRISRR